MGRHVEQLSGTTTLGAKSFRRIPVALPLSAAISVQYVLPPDRFFGDLDGPSSVLGVPFRPLLQRIVLTSDAEHGLGVHMPAGRLRVFAPRDDALDADIASADLCFIGETGVDDIPVQGGHVVRLGAALHVVGRRLVQRVEDDTARHPKRTVRVEVSNLRPAGSTTVQAVLEEHVPSLVDDRHCRRRRVVLSRLTAGECSVAVGNPISEPVLQVKVSVVAGATVALEYEVSYA